MTMIRSKRGKSATGTTTSNGWMTKGTAALGVLGALLCVAPSASALVITGGPIYSLPGGGSCSVTSGTAPTTGTGVVVTCTGVNLSAHSNVYFGIKNIGNVNGAATDNTGPSSGEIFGFSTAGASSITYTSSTSITSLITAPVAFGTDTVSNTLLIARQAGGTVSVVSTSGTPVSNGNGAIERLFKLTSGSSYTFDVDITGSDPHFSGQLCTGVFDPTHSNVSPNGCISKVDLAFYYSDCGDGALDSPEQCDLGANNGLSTTCCTSTCTLRASGQICRASAGACDIPDTCNGSSPNCTADAKSTGVCRAAAGTCDLAESCDGVSNNCPADAKSTNVCRAAAGDCDLAEVCDGVGNNCPTDVKSTSQCRAAAGVCDVAESCDGVINNCPADGFVAASTPCGDGTDDDCTNPDTCDGAGNCAANHESNGTPCTDDGEICTVDECDGGGNCTHPAGNSGTECRAASAGQLCDEAEVCDGVSSSCPVDAPKSVGVVCRPSVGECDVADECDGASFQCGPDEFQPNGEPCTDDGFLCTEDICDGNNSCTHPAGNSGLECRAPASECDVAEQCDGVSSTCPGDDLVVDGTPCTDDTFFCTGDETCQSGTCTSAGNPCPVGVCDDGVDQCVPACAVVPAAGCRTAEKSILLLQDKADNSKDKLIWKWIKGANTDKSEFADPVTTAEYSLCVYTGTTEALVAEVSVPSSTSKWSEKSNGYKYKDIARTEDGIQKVILKASDQGKSKALMKGKGVGLPDPPAAVNPAVDLDLPVRVQLLNHESGICFEGDYDTPDIKKNEPGKFKAKAQ